MSTAQQIGTVASKTDRLFVQRQGEQLVLQQGDAILAGDILQNKDTTAVDVELPATQNGQSNSLLTLSPESAAQLTSVQTAAGTTIEVTSLTEGVELYATGEGADGAVLLAGSGEGFSGLVGAGLLSAGSAGGASGLVTAIGGGVGVAALASSSSSDENVQGSAFTDVRVDNGDETTEPVENPDSSEEPETPADENPEEENPETPVDNPEPPAEEGTTGSPLDVAVDPLVDFLSSSPFSAVSDALIEGLGSAPIGSSPNPVDSLPLDPLTGNLPV